MSGLNLQVWGHAKSKPDTQSTAKGEQGIYICNDQSQNLCRDHGIKAKHPENRVQAKGTGTEQAQIAQNLYTPYSGHKMASTERIYLVPTYFQKEKLSSTKT